LRILGDVDPGIQRRLNIANGSASATHPGSNDIRWRCGQAHAVA